MVSGLFFFVFFVMVFDFVLGGWVGVVVLWNVFSLGIGFVFGVLVLVVMFDFSGEVLLDVFVFLSMVYFVIVVLFLGVLEIVLCKVGVWVLLSFWLMILFVIWFDFWCGVLVVIVGWVMGGLFLLFGVMIVWGEFGGEVYVW